jgi:hypothetical protein
MDLSTFVSIAARVLRLDELAGRERLFDGN